MKIALYIEDGREQIVLTPESDTEKSILAKMHGGSRKISLRKGGFFRCMGGWTREAASQESTMIVLDALDTMEG